MSVTDPPITSPRTIGDYTLERSLGEGAQATTYLVSHPEHDEPLCLKEIRVNQVDDWRQVELFERQTEALQQIDHPAIPRLVDAFHDADHRDGDGRGQRPADQRFVIVQQFLEGQNLQQRLDDGHRFTDADLRQLADEILQALIHLHERPRPIIHRDIKPSNIMARPDGTYALIDFGAVRILGDQASDRTTTAGTTGYTPLEQLAGQAQPASDLYALGATLIHLASGLHPSQLPITELTLDFREHVHLSDHLIAVIEILVKPSPDERFADARQALEALHHPDTLTPDRQRPSTQLQGAHYQWDHSTPKGRFHLQHTPHSLTLSFTPHFNILATGMAILALVVVLSAITPLWYLPLIAAFLLFIALRIQESWRIHIAELSPEALRLRRSLPLAPSTDIPLDAITDVDHHRHALRLHLNAPNLPSTIQFGAPDDTSQEPAPHQRANLDALAGEIQAFVEAH